MRHHFLFLHGCGCPFGLCEQLPTCRDEGEAWELMYDTRAKAKKARDQGVHVKLVDHDTYCREYYPRMTARCSHRGGA